MSLKDKLEIGLKPDAPYRRDNLPDFQQDDPACEVAATPGDTPDLRRAREECSEAKTISGNKPLARQKRDAQPAPRARSRGGRG